MNPLTNPDVFTILADLRRQLDELKTPQTIGSSSTLTRLITTAAAYDRSASISGEKASFSFTFTAERQDYSLSILEVDVAIDAPDNPATFYTDYLQNIRPSVPSRSTPLVSTWNIDLYKTVTGTHTFYLKARVLSTDNGVLS